MHIFPYSRRPGTPADKMPGQHSNDTKEMRSAEAIKVAEGMKKAYLEAQTGTLQEVLFEEMDGAYCTGHTPNYCKVYVEGENLHNQTREVKITGLYKDGLLGTV
jgi:threonylcarbamoyladenosine tRNA methylthiotransferase MtaB